MLNIFWFIDNIITMLNFNFEQIWVISFYLFNWFTLFPHILIFQRLPRFLKFIISWFMASVCDYIVLIICVNYLQIFIKLLIKQAFWEFIFFYIQIYILKCLDVCYRWISFWYKMKSSCISNLIFFLNIIWGNNFIL